MKLRTLLLLLVFGLIAGFAALNWSAILAPTALSLGVADVQAPLGLILLGLMLVLVAVFLVYLLYLQTTVLLDARSHARELQANRTLADQAEASRFTELRTFLQAELQRLTSADQQTHAAVLTRLDQLERDLRRAVEQSGNSVAASLAEMDDRLSGDSSARR